MLPIRPFSAEKAARAWRMSRSGARKILDGFAERALLLDLTDGSDKKFYILPPPMAGFFEFSMMRIREDNQALASHRAMAAILGAILKLPPIKQVLAGSQLQSRWLEAVIGWGSKRVGWMRRISEESAEIAA